MPAGVWVSAFYFAFFAERKLPDKKCEMDKGQPPIKCFAFAALSFLAIAQQAMRSVAEMRPKTINKREASKVEQKTERPAAFQLNFQPVLPKLCGLWEKWQRRGRILNNSTVAFMGKTSKFKIHLKCQQKIKLPLS